MREEDNTQHSVGGKVKPPRTRSQHGPAGNEGEGKKAEVLVDIEAG